MASKRVTLKGIDWAKLGERVAESEKITYSAFKSKSDGYTRRMTANPENPPKIDWDFYRKKIALPGLVDDFQKKYESYEISYPKDTSTHLIDQQEEEVKKKIAKFKDESNERIEKIQCEINEILSMVPYEQMTMEDFKDAHPELALDPLNNPTFWPHTPEEQLGYKPPNVFISEETKPPSSEAPSSKPPSSASPPPASKPPSSASSPPASKPPSSESAPSQKPPSSASPPKPPSPASPPNPPSPASSPSAKPPSPATPAGSKGTISKAKASDEEPIKDDPSDETNEKNTSDDPPNPPPKSQSSEKDKENS